MIKNSIAIKDAADITRSTENCHPPFAFDLVHHLPGRLRLRSASLKGNDQSIETYRQQLAEISGVILAETNRDTGSLLLKYDPTVLTSDKIAEVLAARGFIVSKPVSDVEAEAGWGEAMMSVLKRLILEVLAERIMLAIVGIAV